MNTVQFRAFLIALVAHLLLVMGAFFWHVSGKGADSYSVRMVFPEEVEIEEEEPEQKEDPKPRNDRWNRLDEANTNEAVNKALDNLTEAQRIAMDEKIAKEIRDLAEETSETGLNPKGANGSGVTEQTSKPETESVSKPGKETKTDDLGNTHDDVTNIRYFLENRKHLYRGLVNPVYLCEEGGVVRVDIEVSAAGRVISTSVDNSKSERNPCLREAATRAASESRFNAGTNQKGWIEYRFIPQ